MPVIEEPQGVRVRVRVTLTSSDLLSSFTWQVSFAHCVFEVQAAYYLASHLADSLSDLGVV